MVKLLTVDEVADRLSTTPGALRYAIHVGRAPKSGKVGGRRMFRESDVEAYIAEAFAD
ncbi:helix-turn-helix transcriptional regulator [Microbacterium sp. Leaf151]|uniref:helix-turn-helix transcriptional regulator n=1 Tax=Microbacterium sp. Leaf151 TaxID=1736276 RepID=UPI0009EA188B|nr:helix-turn-helix domain-containing protein [Microbacterium sp. Leaf151]